jgi:gamma-glutamyltranspeptidase/glutathione hydrolase
VARSKLINSENATAGFTNGNPVLNKGETVYLTVADEAGNMVSLIQSICSGFGSEMVPDGLGFVLQNRGLMFTLQEGENNTYAPHKRPFHTIIPAFVTKDGLPYMSFGVMGGGFQPVGHVQVLMNIIDFGMNIQEAGDAPRIFPSGYSQPMGQKQGKEEIALESGFSSETIRSLKDMRHSNIVYGTPGLFGGYQCIKYDAVKNILRRLRSKERWNGCGLLILFETFDMLFFDSALLILSYHYQYRCTNTRKLYLKRRGLRYNLNANLLA